MKTVIVASTWVSITLATGERQAASADAPASLSGPDASLSSSKEVTEKKPDKSYAVQGPPMIAKTDTPVFDLPFSVQTVPSAVMEDQNAQTVYDALRNVSGVHQNKGISYNSCNDGGIIRGFQTTQMYYNGFLIEAGSAMNLPNLERVEVLKGPASMEYGVVQPGGLINVVTKQPRREFSATLEQSFGSYNDYETVVDVTGPLTKDGTVSYRLNGGNLTTDSFRNYVEENRYWVAPSVTWQPVETVRITFDLSYGERDKTLDEGVAFNSAGKPVAPISTFLGEPGLPGQQQKDLFLGPIAEFKPNENLTLRSALLYHHWDIDLNGVRRSATTTAANTVARLYDRSDFSEDELQWMNEVIWKYTAGPTKHEWLAGVDYRDRAQPIDLNRASYTPVNIINPVYGSPLPATSFLGRTESDRTWVGVYLQDQISMLPNDCLKLLVGGRFDDVDSSDYSSTATPQTLTRNDQATSGRVGLLFQPVKYWGVYSSVSQSFVPTSTGSRTASGALLDPESGVQYEAGFKLKWLDDRVLTTFAVYQLTKENVAIADVNNPGFSINGGKLRSQGFEFDTAGELIKGLQVIANYTYTGTEVLRSDTLPVGVRLANVPLNSGSLWLKYTLQEGPLKNLGIGAGVFTESEKAGDDNNTFLLPAYARIDVGLFYRRELPKECVVKAVNARLNIQNVADTVYYESSFANSRVFPGQPLTIVGTIGLEF